LASEVKHLPSAIPCCCRLRIAEISDSCPLQCLTLPIAWRLFPRPSMGVGLDLLAAAGYALHFIAPWTTALILWRTTKRHSTFLCALGILNTLAVITQFFFPTAPPWYFEKYGFMPATYSMPGDPAGLQYSDILLGTQFFHRIYYNSPVVFGAFPSLHAAWPILIIQFLPLGGPFATLKWLYPVWLWWAAIYLQHHFFVDLLGGAVYCALALHLARMLAPAPPAASGKKVDDAEKQLCLEDDV